MSVLVEAYNHNAVNLVLSLILKGQVDPWQVPLLFVCGTWEVSVTTNWCLGSGSCFKNYTWYDDYSQINPKL